MSELTKLELGDKIICKDAPEWGTWKITKTPTTKEDWYDKKGESGENILHICELKFWELAE